LVMHLASATLQISKRSEISDEVRMAGEKSGLGGEFLPDTLFQLGNFYLVLLIKLLMDTVWEFFSYCYSRWLSLFSQVGTAVATLYVKGRWLQRLKGSGVARIFTYQSIPTTLLKNKVGQKGAYK